MWNIFSAVNTVSIVEINWKGSWDSSLRMMTLFILQINVAHAEEQIICNLWSIEILWKLGLDIILKYLFLSLTLFSHWSWLLEIIQYSSLTETWICCESVISWLVLNFMIMEKETMSKWRIWYWFELWQALILGFFFFPC